MHELTSDDAMPPWDRKRIAVRVKPAALREIRRGHPWLFDGSIVSASNGGRAGDLAVVFDDQRKFAAIGLYDPMSPIRVRMLHHGDPRRIDDQWLAEKVRAALDQRRSLVDRSDTTAYRLIHGENDGLGGLVADLYGPHLVVKIYSDAWIPWLSAIASAMAEVLGDQLRSVTLRAGRNVSLPANQTTVLFGTAPPGTFIVLENGLQIEVDLRHGHKTGYFLDQRSNRALIRSHSDGRSVLDVFASTGGFSVHAAAGGATAITAIDVAQPALQQASQTLALNGYGSDKPFFAALCGDAFRLLGQLCRAGREFDLVIVDPPSMAVRQDQVGQAIDAYRRLSSLAGKLVKPGGLLYLASCTARVSPQEFRDASLLGLRQSGVKVTVIAETGHDVDHPIGFAEGRYLKGILLASDRVDGAGPQATQWHKAPNRTF